MFTVVIAEQEHINNIEKYSLFLKPFADRQHTVIQKWNREGRSFRECVPGLEETIEHHREWRAIVLCGQDAISQKNPFDFVSCSLPEKPEGLDEGSEEGYQRLAQYYDECRERKFAAYEQAMERPLTRLVTYLCEPPISGGGFNHELLEQTGDELFRQQGYEGEDYERQMRKLRAEQLEYQEYLAEAARKEQLRTAIVGSELCDIIRPQQVLCIALRTKDVQAHDLREQWKPHVNHQYNRFFDWNMYFDKMRYLVFDILPKENRRYELDYIRFLSALLLLANNELPPDGVRSNLVYTVDCQHDDRALERLLLEYDAKLTLTDEMLERSITERRLATREKLSDGEVERLYCSGVTVSVTPGDEFDRSQLYVSSEGIGLSGDCPGGEDSKWAHDYETAKYALTRFLKQPRRALQKAVSTMHTMSAVATDDCARLDSFQREDIAEHVFDEELAMVDVPTRSIHDTEDYFRRMEEVNRQMERKLEERMTRKRTVVLGMLALGTFLIGFAPMLLGNLRGGDGAEAAGLIALSLLLLAAAAVVCLFCLRREVTKLFKRFNLTMCDIENDIDDAMTKYSAYLSRACGVMRGNCVLNHLGEANEPEQRTIRLYRKHQQDIRRQRAELRETFGGVMPQRGRNAALADQEPYAFDFTKAKDYVYPMPYREELKRRIVFIQSGNMIEAPVNFIDRIEVRLEELYD